MKVEDEVTDVICEKCGRKMVVKFGRYGKFLACPGFPECSFTMPIVVEMPGKCPKCGSRNLTKIDRMNGYLSYSRVHGDTRLNEAKMAEIAERKSM